MPSEMGAPKQIKITSLNDYLEVMSKVVFQSGMSWKMIENKWPDIRAAMDNFDIRQVADYDERDIERLTGDARVIRNYRKLVAISGNARRILELDKQHGSFKKYLESHGSFDAALKTLRKDFKFMGPMGIYYFLFVVGETVPTHENFQKQYR
ncbi:MAG TPA: DNA-3-methyladenine glycosylase I [Anaerolineales bacterium]|nr:DNA-3-methyladenine glycosylase I [Anaerolineales bacterium]HLE72766.1 DNA-3-methyladenine glycosylase I [Anaerolineales bacterium]